jgi:hypothetical protein
LPMSRLPHQWVLGLQNLLAGELESCPFGPRDIDEQTGEEAKTRNTIRSQSHAASHIRMPIKMHQNIHKLVHYGTNHSTSQSVVFLHQ